MGDIIFDIGFNNRSIQKSVSDLRKTMSKGLKNIFTGASAKSLKKDAAKLGNDLAKTFSNGLKGVSKYVFGLRSLFFMYRKLREATIDAMKSLGEYSQSVQKDINSIMASISSAKYSLATAFQPIVPYLAAIISKIVSMLNALARAVGTVFAVITGQNFLWQANVNTEQFTDSLGGATKAAEKLKRALAPFDDINVLPQNDEDQSGGGGGAGDMGDVLGWEQIPLNEKVKNFVEELKKMIEAGDWEGVGRLLAEKVNEGLDWLYDAISWENVGPKITAFIDAFSAAFNSFVDNLNFYKLGQVVGAFVNDIVNTFNYLYKKIDWKNLGKKTGEGFRGMLDEINWTNLGNFIGAKFMVAWKIFGGFLDTMFSEDGAGITGWEKLGTSIGEAIMGVFDDEKGINLTEIANSIARFINGAFETAIATGVTIDFSELGTKVGNAITEFLTTLNPEDFATAVNTWVLGLIDFIRSMIQTADWEQLGADIAEALSKIDWKGIFEGAFGVLTDVLGAALDVLKGFTDVAPGFGSAMITFLGAFAGYEILTHASTAIETFSKTMEVAASGTAISNIGLLGIAIGGLIGASIAIDNLGQDLRDFATDTLEALGKDEWDDARQNMDDMAESIHNFIEKNDTIVGKADSDSAKLDILLETYDKLVEKEHLTSDEQMTLHQTAQDLITLVPSLKGVIDPVTGSYNGQKEAVHELVDAQKEYLRVSAYSEALKDYNQQIVDSKVELIKQGAVLDSARQKQQALLTLFRDVGPESTKTFEEQNRLIAEFNEQFGTEFKDWQEMADVLNSSTTEIELMEKSYSNLDKEIKNLELQRDALTKSMEEEQAAYAETKRAQEELDYANLVLKQSEAIDQMHGIWSEGVQILGQDALDIQAEIEAGLTPDENGMYTLANGMMVEYGTGLEDGGKNAIQTLDEGFLTDLNTTLANQGKTLGYENGQLVIQEMVSGMEEESNSKLTPAGATAIAKFIEGSDSASEELKKSFEGYAAMSTDALIEKIETAGPEMQTVMETMMQLGLIDPTETGLNTIEERWVTSRSIIAGTHKDIAGDVSTTNQDIVDNVTETGDKIQELTDAQITGINLAHDTFNQDTIDKTNWANEELLSIQDTFNTDTETKDSTHQDTTETNFQQHMDQMLSDAKQHYEDSKEAMSQNNSDQTDLMTEHYEGLEKSTTETYEDINQTITDKMSDAESTISDKTSDMANDVDGAWDDMNKSTENKWKSIGDTVKSWIDKLKGWISDFASMISSAIDNIKSMVSEAQSAQSSVDSISSSLASSSSSSGPGYGPGYRNIANYAAMQRLADIPIPKLATGAVIPPNRRFLAELGDQTSGVNVEAPLDTIRQAVSEVMAQFMGSSQSMNAEMTLDGQTFARLEVPYVINELRRLGYNVTILEE